MSNKNNSLGQLGLRLDETRPSWIEDLKIGATTWHRGERCTVEAVEMETFAQPMVIVRFGDGRQGIFKSNELGLRAADIKR